VLLLRELFPVIKIPIVRRSAGI